MDNRESKAYYKGYIAGYIAGVKDAESGDVKPFDMNNISSLPIGFMTVSSRGLNCLSGAGCVYISDVAKLDDNTIRTMRSMGTKTASEIAHWLDDHGIHFSAWSRYL